MTKYVLETLYVFTTFAALHFIGYRAQIYYPLCPLLCSSLSLTLCPHTPEQVRSDTLLGHPEDGHCQGQRSVRPATGAAEPHRVHEVGGQGVGVLIFGSLVYGGCMNRMG